MNIGKNISDLRREKGMTQLQLAEKLGVSGQSVSKWENGVCAPDVSQFPLLAELFGVSIDRLFGFRQSSGEELGAILARADEFETLEENLAFLKENLEKYPNSPELKVALAWSSFSAWRTGLGGVDREEAKETCLRLCREVERSCGERAQVDDALELMSRVWRERGEYDRAQACLEKLSAEAYGLRLGGMGEILQRRGETAALERFAEREIRNLWHTLWRMLSLLRDSLSAAGEKDRALAYAQAAEKLLGLFDAGCPSFFAYRKLLAAEACASLRMEMGDKAGCLYTLGRIAASRELVRASAQAGSHHEAERNPLFFSGLREDPRAMEEWAPEFPFGPIFRKYEAFFGDDQEFRKLLETVEKEGKAQKQDA